MVAKPTNVHLVAGQYKNTGYNYNIPDTGDTLSIGSLLAVVLALAWPF
ncbi:hypothetical protein GCM10007881_64030 [Mesorhizobium huakuii]|nr:hypothetical protein [Mesorhizobium huakuii]GLQ82880.1 hypothetical protein GCM10007881_64030 [Mesorhizobium huakuii]